MPGLRLQTPSEVDLLGALAAASDPQAQRWLGWPDRDAGRAGQWTAFLDATPGTGRKPRRLGQGAELLLAAVDPAGERLAGAIGVSRETGEVGGWLAPRFRGCGLGGALFAAAAELAHHHLGIASVIAGTEPGNAACIGALSAAGFIPATGSETHTLPNGRVVDARWFRHESGQPARC
jgi:RimJ/RimL family protein N-acetyltransferase